LKYFDLLIYNNIHKISWDHVNKFEINLMNKKFSKEF